MGSPDVHAEFALAAQSLLRKHADTLKQKFLTTKQRAQCEKYIAMAMSKVLCAHVEITWKYRLIGPPGYNVRCSNCKLSIHVRNKP